MHYLRWFAVALTMALGFTLPAQADVTFTGATLGDVILSVPALGIGDTGSATYAAGQTTLNSGDKFPNFFDTAEVDIPNGLDGVSLGTLNTFLASGSTFDLVSMTPGNPGLYAYWDLQISNGVNTYEVNSYGDNVLGSNVIDTGQGTGVSASPQLGNLFQSWATFAGTYGTYSVIDASIDVGGWNQGGPQIAVIDSITLPGTFTESTSVNEPPAFALLLIAVAFLLHYRRGPRLRT